MRPLMCEGRTPPMELQDRSGQMLRPDQATASRQRAERSGKEIRRALRGPARRGRAQGTAASSERGIIDVLQEQGDRCGGGADPGRRRRHGGRAHRGIRVGGHAVVRPGLRQPVQLPVRHAQLAELHGGRATAGREDRPADHPVPHRELRPGPGLDRRVPGHGGRLLRGQPGGCGRRRCTTAASRPGCPAELPDLSLQRHHHGHAGQRSRITWRSRTSTRRSAWTRACAWAWPRPRSRTRA